MGIRPDSPEAGDHSLHSSERYSSDLTISDVDDDCSLVSCGEMQKISDTNGLGSTQNDQSLVPAKASKQVPNAVPDTNATDGFVPITPEKTNWEMPSLFSGDIVKVKSGRNSAPPALVSDECAAGCSQRETMCRETLPLTKMSTNLFAPVAMPSSLPTFPQFFSRPSQPPQPSTIGGTTLFSHEPVSLGKRSVSDAMGCASGIKDGEFDGWLSFFNEEGLNLNVANRGLRQDLGIDQHVFDMENDSLFVPGQEYGFDRAGAHEGQQNEFTHVSPSREYKPKRNLFNPALKSKKKNLKNKMAGARAAVVKKSSDKKVGAKVPKKPPAEKKAKKEKKVKYISVKVPIVKGRPKGSKTNTDAKIAGNGFGFGKTAFDFTERKYAATVSDESAAILDPDMDDSVLAFIDLQCDNAYTYANANANEGTSPESCFPLVEKPKRGRPPLKKLKVDEIEEQKEIQAIFSSKQKASQERQQAKVASDASNANDAELAKDQAMEPKAMELKAIEPKVIKPKARSVGRPRSDESPSFKGEKVDNTAYFAASCVNLDNIIYSSRRQCASTNGSGLY